MEAIYFKCVNSSRRATCIVDACVISKFEEWNCAFQPCQLNAISSWTTKKKKIMSGVNMPSYYAY